MELRQYVTALSNASDGTSQNWAISAVSDAWESLKQKKEPSPECQASLPTAFMAFKKHATDRFLGYATTLDSRGLIVC